ncbi:MAG: (Fe-S)-binding protein [Candidatus Lokiarchaeota archaeon]|nr:(Fe-S)-binding protein [Candidatus Lokiarchaeota archaeon]
MALQEFKDIVHRCFRCGYCKFTTNYDDFNCPAYKKFRLESYSTGGKMWLVYGLMKGELDWSPHLSEIMYSCTTCANCIENCRFEKFNKIFVDVIEAARSEAFNKGLTPAKLLAFGEHARREHNPYMEGHADRLNWIAGGFQNPPDPEVAFFVGCTASYREQQLARSTADVMRKAGVKFAVYQDEWCCGSPLLRTGQRDAALEMANHNIDLFEGLGTKKVVTACAGCYRTLKMDYPKLTGKDVPFEVLHVSELVNRLIDEGRIKFGAEPPQRVKVTYHDPCHLGRHSNLYDAPREVLKKIPGIDVIEMAKNKGNASCCGAGGGVKSGNPEWAVEMAGDRVKEALETGAGTLVTTCPFCERNFRDAISKNSDDVDLLDLVELVNERMQ